MRPSDSNRFIHQGHGLDHWLWELVCDDIDCREIAADVIDQMRFGISADQSDEAIKAFFEEFDKAVRSTLARPDFNARAFVEALIDFIPAAQAQRMQLVHEETERSDRVYDEMVARLGEEKGRKAWAKTLRVSIDQPNKNEQMQEQLLHQGVTAAVVFGALGEELLIAPDRLLGLLRDRHHQYLAAEALGRIGPAARSFADELLHQLKSNRERRMAEGLAAIIRDDAAMIHSVVDRLQAKDPEVAAGAADVLYYLGERAAELAPESIDALLALANRRDWARSCLGAVGAVARGTDLAVDRLLLLSRDRDNEVQGSALAALGQIGRQPDRLVPRLIQAFDDYQEQNPDLFHNSEHELVVCALQQFGPAAAPATPTLIKHIYRSDDNELDRGVIETLGKIGPPAREALPVLEKLAKERDVEQLDPQDTSDFLVEAINRIRGNLGGPR
jgi:hypothetical protein